MTPDQLAELAQRLLNHAAMHDSVVPHDDGRLLALDPMRLLPAPKEPTT